MTTLALIGVGRWGKNIINTLEKIPNANLKYLCANSPEHLSLYPNSYEKVLDWHILLDKSDLTAVLIATPASTHLEIATAFLEKKIPVFTEKPMVLTSTDAKKLETVAKESNTLLMVGYQYVYNDYIRFIKREIDADNFGKILNVISEQSLIPPSADIDVFTDAGPHPLSIFQFIFNPQKIVEISGKIEHEFAKVSVQFENAPVLEVVTSCSGEKKVRKLTIQGEKVTAVLDETLQTKKLAITKNGETTYPEINAGEPLKNELEYFLGCLRTGNAPITNVDFGCQITEWLEIISEKLK